MWSERRASRRSQVVPHVQWSSSASRRLMYATRARALRPRTRRRSRAARQARERRARSYEAVHHRAVGAVVDVEQVGTAFRPVAEHEPATETHGDVLVGEAVAVED